RGPLGRSCAADVSVAGRIALKVDEG
ncbi:MAG: hypothetical protein JWQ83_1271, partial [Lacunisphaera sp.]|nr:hypothetical protein [Lacunisphaera sp.]